MNMPTRSGLRRLFNTLLVVAGNGAFAFAQSASAASDFPATDCVVQPYQVVDLGSPVAGLIEKVMVERSDYVEIGQEVAKINDRVEVATVELAKARTKIEAQMQAETINVEFDVKSQRRIDSLYGRQVIPIENKDAADRDVELSRWRLEQVKDLRDVRNLELERAKKLVEQKLIRSPLNGFVLIRYKSKGEFIEDQPIMRIAQLDPLNIEAILPMKYFGMIKPGMKAAVQPEVVTTETREARVVVVDRVGDAAAGTFGVRLEMSNPNFQIPAGLKCEVRFMPTSDAELAEFQSTRQKERLEAAVVAQDLTNDLVENQPEENPELISQPPTQSNQTTQSNQSINSLGPFHSKAELAEARLELGAQAVTEREETVSSIINYFVLAVGEDEAEVRARIERLGVEDFGYIYRGDYKGRYSLGVYSKERAFNRAESLNSLGLATEVIARTKTEQQWWLDISDSVSERRDEKSADKKFDRSSETTAPVVVNLVQNNQISP